MTRTITQPWNPARSSTIRLSSNGMTTSMGEPTEENVLKALEDLQVDFADVIDTDDSIEEYLSVSNIEEEED